MRTPSATKNSTISIWSRGMGGTLVAVFLWFGSLSSIAAPADQIDVIKQTQIFLGDVKVYLGRNAIRIEGITKPFVLISKAPDWSVVVYNTQKKIIAHRTFQEWSDYGLRSYFPIPKQTAVVELVRVGKQNICGISADKYVIPFVDRFGSPLSLAKGIRGAFITTTAFAVPKQEISILTGLYNDRKFKVTGFPLEFSIVELSQRATHGYIPPVNPGSFKSTGVTKVAETANLFKVPSGMKEVSHEFEIFVDSSQREAMEDVAEDMGVGDSLGTGKGKDSTTTKKHP